MVTASSVELLWQRPLTIEVSEADGTVVSTGNGPPLPLGDAVHQVMEVVDLAAPGSLDEIVDAVCAEFGLVDRRDEVQALVERCLASPADRARDRGRARAGVRCRSRSRGTTASRSAAWTCCSSRTDAS